MRRQRLPVLLGLTVFVLTLSSSARGDQPGRGLTGPFEIEFMKFTMDHHFAALRMTKLAAGMDRLRIEAQ